jgi:hypothetical protein
MKSFKVCPADELLSLELPGEYASKDCWALVEFKGEIPIRIVATDGGEPEDQSLVRDWSWVKDEMNKLAEESNKLRSELEQAHVLIDTITLSR